MTYACVLIGSVFFRAPTVSAAVSLLAGMAGAHGVSVTAPPVDIAAAVEWFAALYAIVWLMPNTAEIFGTVEPAAALLRFRLSRRWALAIGGGFTLGVLSLGGASEFLYFQF